MGLLLLIPWFEAKGWTIPLPLKGHITIEPFGVLVAVGIFLAAMAAERRTEACGVSREAVADLVLHVVPLALLTAYLLNPLFYYPEKALDLFLHPQQWTTEYQGLSSFGGFIGAVIGALVWQYRRRQSLLAAGDALAFAFPLGWLFGRTGCFLVHDHPGVASRFPLAVDNWQLSGVARHDLGLYEALWSAAILCAFWALARKPRPRGFYLGWLPVLYSVARFFLDFLRESPEMGGDRRYLGFTPGQYGAIALLAAGVALLWRVYRHPEPTITHT